MCYNDYIDKLIFILQLCVSREQGFFCFTVCQYVYSLETTHVERNFRSWLIHVARCFGFPFHNFLTGSDSQTFRVLAYIHVAEFSL